MGPVSRGFRVGRVWGWQGVRRGTGSDRVVRCVSGLLLVVWHLASTVTQSCITSSSKPGTQLPSWFGIGGSPVALGSGGTKFLIHRSCACVYVCVCIFGGEGSGFCVDFGLLNRTAPQHKRIDAGGSPAAIRSGGTSGDVSPCVCICGFDDGSRLGFRAELLAAAPALQALYGSDACMCTAVAFADPHSPVLPALPPPKQTVVKQNAIPT